MLLSCVSLSTYPTTTEAATPGILLNMFIQGNKWLRLERGAPGSWRASRQASHWLRSSSWGKRSQSALRSFPSSWRPFYRICLKIWKATGNISGLLGPTESQWQKQHKFVVSDQTLTIRQWAEQGLEEMTPLPIFYGEELHLCFAHVPWVLTLYSLQ